MNARRIEGAVALVTGATAASDVDPPFCAVK